MGETKTLSRLSGKLHWVHWAVVFLSLVLTVGAWWISKQQIEDKVRERFEREASQVIELVTERMQKYEDGLWGGVSAIQALGRSVSHRDWVTFSKNLRIEKKYPGINGIGVIHYVSPKTLKAYLTQQRKIRPNYSIHPKHENPEYWPITYIEPSGPNAKAIGLDMAYESNRFVAAKKARDTGKAQITGPIVLVQDADKTPGFLFYAPFYRGGVYSDLGDRQKHFIGLVYAPFVVKKLMEGTLRKENRHVGIKITDGVDILYDEYDEQFREFDKNPLYTKHVEMDFYGRRWIFDIRSTTAFRAAINSNQPLIILFGGIVIDTLLLLLFLTLVRSNQRNMQYAKKMGQEALNQKQAAIQSAKLASLGEMAGGIAHEINNPLSIIQGYVMRLKDGLGALNIDTTALEGDIERIKKTIGRISAIVEGLRRFSRDDREASLESTSLNQIIDDTLGLCREKFKNRGVDMNVSVPTCDMMITCRPIQISQVIINILNNAFQAIQSEEVKSIVLNTEARDGHVFISISNSGRKITDDIVEKIFEPFFTTKTVGEGTGLGLSLSMSIVKDHGGRLYLDQAAEMTTFVIQLPLAKMLENAA